MKIIVSSISLEEDPSLIFIRQFRMIARKLCLAHSRSDSTEFITAMKELSSMERRSKSEFGFDIWVNHSGQVGHTYEKDYIVTNENDHLNRDIMK